MDLEFQSKMLRDAAIECLRNNGYVDLADLLFNTNYFACTIGIGGTKEEYKRGVVTQDRVYVIVDFTSKQEEHIEDLGLYCKSTYSMFMKEKRFLC